MAFNVFDIPMIMDKLDNDMAAGLEPDPAVIAWLVNEGPKAVEKLVDTIETAEGEAAMIASRIKELQGRKQAREKTAERLKDFLAETLDTSFQGKIKTAEVTVWTQVSTSYDFPDESVIPVTYMKPQPPRVDKLALVNDIKAGTLPSEIPFVTHTRSTLRIRR